MTILEELKKEYTKHLNSIGIDMAYVEEEYSEFYCDCATEEICEKKREALLKDIKVLEEE